MKTEFRKWWYVPVILAALFMIMNGCEKDEDIPDKPKEKTPREKALDEYKNNYLGSVVTNPEWTGSTAGCNAGTVPMSVQEKVLQRIRYYRKMCGLPTDISMDTVKSRKCQEAALMSLANGNLSHNPPASWNCYTADGAEACANSNLSLGNHSVNAVSGQVRDDGSNNKACGHRRWILYSRLKTVGHGSTSSSQALWVLGNGGNPLPSNLPSFISWPPKGYVPAPVVYNRWSLSIPAANFANAAVTMTDDSGSPVSLTIVSSIDNGYGDNTIVWEPVGIVLNNPEDQKYSVKVDNVIVTGNPKFYTYDVIIMQVL